MATLPNHFATAAPVAADRTDREPYRLRALPQEEVFFYCKRIDNSRLVREADPQARGACWSAIGGATVALALLTGVLVPGVANTLAGYKLQSLRAEQQRLVDERRTLELQEAEALSPENLVKLAKRHNLDVPKANQMVHLEDDQPTSAVALAK